MKTIKLKQQHMYCGNLLLVNAQHPLQTAAPPDLVPADVRFPDILMKQDAAGVLQFILKKIEAETSIVPVSGYRSLEEQTDIYKTSLDENGEDFTKKYVALPNHSEHQTGLAIDLGQKKEEIDFIRPDFPYHGICNIFRETAPEYGFVERYEKGKEDVTGISHEPWHFRYVGWPHSKIMKERGISLEEYTEFIKHYRDDCRYVFRNNMGERVEIYYVPFGGETTILSMPEEGVFQISGNNVDGFTVTVWRKEDDGKEKLCRD